GSVIGVALCVPGVSAETSHPLSALTEMRGLGRMHQVVPVALVANRELESRTRELERAFEPRVESGVATDAACADDDRAPETASAAETTAALPEPTEARDADSGAQASPGSAPGGADFDQVLRDLEHELNELRAA